MNKVVKLVAIGLGANALFAVAFVGSALMRGAAFHEIPVIGKLAQAPEATPAGPAEELPAPGELQPEKPFPPRRAAQAGVFDVFRLQSPYSNRELAKLVDELKGKILEADLRLADLEEQEEHLAERQEVLDEQFRTLQRMRTDLEEFEAELEARSAEIARDEASAAQRGQERWSTLAGLFAEGDPEELSTRLQDYAPGDAARILHALPEERARQLLAALPEAQWKDYAEAYSAGE